MTTTRHLMQDPTPVLVVTAPGEQPQRATLGAFLTDNREGFRAQEMHAIARAIARGEIYLGGGGAQPAWTVSPDRGAAQAA